MFFDAPDMVPVTQAHIMADPESLGDAGTSFVEQLAKRADRVRVPTITDPRGVDFAKADRLGHTAAMQQLERRIIDGLERLGVLMTNTCINYQTILPPLRGEHIAMGDTGVAIYSQQRARRPHQFRRWPLGAGRRTDRTHTALWLSSRFGPARDRAGRAGGAAKAAWRNGARSAAWSAGSPKVTGAFRSSTACAMCPARTR